MAPVVHNLILHLLASHVHTTTALTIVLTPSLTISFAVVIVVVACCLCVYFVSSSQKVVTLFCSHEMMNLFLLYDSQTFRQFRYRLGALTFKRTFVICWVVLFPPPSPTEYSTGFLFTQMTQLDVVAMLGCTVSVSLAAISVDDQNILQITSIRGCDCIALL